MPLAPEPWEDDALCAWTDPEAFFVDTHRGPLTKEERRTLLQAKRVCGRCSVSVPCLNTALANPDLIGVWGGLTDKERLRMRKRVDEYRVLLSADSDGVALDYGPSADT